MPRDQSASSRSTSCAAYHLYGDMTYRTDFPSLYPRFRDQWLDVRIAAWARANIHPMTSGGR